VLSSLTLGLAVDFAIHFIERSRKVYNRTSSWEKAIGDMFKEPARAIYRNVIVIAVGFTPLLAAPLVPYNTVGIFLASIMAISGIATMFILPSLITALERRLFRKN
jgi:predicted RND superfamily exporter protein